MKRDKTEGVGYSVSGGLMLEAGVFRFCCRTERLDCLRLKAGCDRGASGSGVIWPAHILPDRVTMVQLGASSNTDEQ